MITSVGLGSAAEAETEAAEAETEAAEEETVI
jgi:hypothetical protein